MNRLQRAVRKLADQVAPEAIESEDKIARDASAYWSGSESDTQRRDYSHWRGEGRYADHSVWDSIGQDHRRMFQELKLLCGREKPVARMVEWGQGGGSNAVAFLEEYSEFTGVDISAPNLDECDRQLRSRGYEGMRKVCIDAPNPESALQKIEPGIDFFLSTAVFQHFPGKEYGLRVLKVAHRLLADDGIALIQTRYDDGTEHYKAKKHSYEKDAITFTSYGIAEFWKSCENTGFEPLFVKLQPRANYAFYYLKKRP